MSAQPEVLCEAGQALRICPLFSRLREEEIEALVEQSWQLSAPAGEVLFEEGEAGEFLYVIVSGSVREVSRTGPDREQVHGLLGPGASVGEMSLLDGGPRPATAIVARPARLIRIDRENLDQLQARSPEAATRFLSSAIRRVSSRLRSANLRLHELAHLGLEARVEIEEMRSQILSLRSQVTGRAALSAEMIKRHSEQLEILADDLIALTFLQVGVGVRQPSEIDLVELTEEAVAQVEEAAAEKEVRLRRFYRGEAIRLGGDRVLLSRALLHLISSAVKLSAPAGAIRVETEKVDGTVRVSVADQGPGIPALARQGWFEPSQFVAGTDIGLALVKHVAEAHGGCLRVESEPAGGGRLILELPRAEGGDSLQE